MKKKKILFVSIFREGEGGGEGRVAYEIARWFSNRHSVVMLCPGEKTGLTQDETGFYRYTIKSSGKGNIAVPLLSIENVRKIFRFLDSYNPDVIHVHDPALLGVIVQTWAQLHHTLLFYTAHIIPNRALDFGANEMSKLVSTPINERLAERYLLAFYQNCDAVVGLNETTANEIRAFGYSGPIEIIPNGRNLNLYNACHFANPQTQTYQLTFVGFLSTRKNQAFLLEVMRYLPENYQLKLIGEALSQSFLKELTDVVEKYNLNVIFTGQQTQEQIVNALEESHVFVSASKMEVQSLVIIEALASGTPVVALSNETVDELISPVNGVNLPKETKPQAFAKAVETLCTLPSAEYNALCEGSRNRVAHMHWTNVMDKTIDSYNRLQIEKDKEPELYDRRKLLKHYLNNFPAGPIRNELSKYFSKVIINTPPKISLNPKSVGLTLINMVTSVIVYWVLKIPLKLLELLGHLKKDKTN